MVYERKRAGEDVIVLSLGEAFFEIPLFDFARLDYKKGYHYSESQGIPELREKIAAYYTQRYGVGVDPAKEILVTAGSKALLYMSMLGVLQPGEEVILHEPAWLSYPDQVRLAGGKARFIPYEVPPRDFEKFLTPRTRILVLNNPNNPAGRLYPKEEVQLLSRVCSGRGIYLLVDEAYSDFVLDDSFASAAQFNPAKEFIIVVNSLSKNMGMSGWRLGYAIAHPEVIQVLLKINQHLLTCAPTILQMYCAKYFDQILSHTLPQVRAVVERRQRIAKVIEHLGLETMAGGATFYFFVLLQNYPGTSLDCAMELLERHGVSVVPGFAYGKGMDRFIRVSIGSESEERILIGLERIKNVITQTKASGVVFTTEQALEENELAPTQELGHKRASSKTRQKDSKKTKRISVRMPR